MILTSIFDNNPKVEYHWYNKRKQSYKEPNIMSKRSRLKGRLVINWSNLDTDKPIICHFVHK